MTTSGMLVIKLGQIKEVRNALISTDSSTSSSFSPNISIIFSDDCKGPCQKFQSILKT